MAATDVNRGFAPGFVHICVYQDRKIFYPFSPFEFLFVVVVVKVSKPRIS